MTNCVRDGHARSAMSGLRDWCARPWRANRRMARIGVFGRSQNTRGYRNPQYIASGRCSDWNRTGKSISSFPAIHFFVEKVRDIVGLYLHPPENAVVLCVDEKSGIQALERTKPMLP